MLLAAPPARVYICQGSAYHATDRCEGGLVHLPRCSPDQSAGREKGPTPLPALRGPLTYYLMDCLICHARPADAVGSHIISHLLLESMSNGPVKGRDREQNFDIRATGSKAYFGRGVLPETIQDTMGRELDETDATQNFYVRDNIFCTVCEKRLAVFESLYKEKIHPALSAGRSLNERQQPVAYVFWLSIIYRCAVTGFDDFVVTPGLLDMLRIVVNQVLADTPAQTEQNCLQEPIAFNLFIGYLPAAADNSTNVVELQKEVGSPYLLAINQHILLLDYQFDQVPALEQRLSVGLPIANPGLTTTLFSLAQRLLLIRFFHRVSADRFKLQVTQNFQRAYFEQHRQDPSANRVESFMTELKSGSELPTVKYSEKRVQELIQRHVTGPPTGQA